MIVFHRYQPIDLCDFENHFEWEGEGWLYYRDGWRAPVALSDAEQERALRLHHRLKLLAVAALIAAPLVGIFAYLDALTDATRSPIVSIALVAAFAVLVALTKRATGWLVTRPFASRRPVGPARNPDALREQAVDREPWGGLLFGLAVVLAIAFIAWRIGRWGDFAGSLIVIASVLLLALRKWRLERRRRRAAFVRPTHTLRRR